MTIGRYALVPHIPFKASGAVKAARFVTIAANDSEGNQAVKFPTADSDPPVGIPLFDAADTEVAKVDTCHGAIYQVETAAAVTVGQELMLDVTAAAEGRVKPATSGKRVVALAVETQATVGERVGVILKDYFKP